MSLEQDTLLVLESGLRLSALHRQEHYVPSEIVTRELVPILADSQYISLGRFHLAGPDLVPLMPLPAPSLFQPDSPPFSYITSQLASSETPITFVWFTIITAPTQYAKGFSNGQTLTASLPEGNYLSVFNATHRGEITWGLVPLSDSSKDAVVTTLNQTASQTVHLPETSEPVWLLAQALSAQPAVMLSALGLAPCLLEPHPLPPNFSPSKLYLTQDLNGRFHRVYYDSNSGHWVEGSLLVADPKGYQDIVKQDNALNTAIHQYLQTGRETVIIGTPHFLSHYTRETNGKFEYGQEVITLSSTGFTAKISYTNDPLMAGITTRSLLDSSSPFPPPPDFFSSSPDQPFSTETSSVFNPAVLSDLPDLSFTPNLPKPDSLAPDEPGPSLPPPYALLAIAVFSSPPPILVSSSPLPQSSVDSVARLLTSPPNPNASFSDYPTSFSLQPLPPTFPPVITPSPPRPNSPAVSATNLITRQPVSPEAYISEPKPNQYFQPEFPTSNLAASPGVVAVPVESSISHSRVTPPSPSDILPSNQPFSTKTPETKMGELLPPLLSSPPHHSDQSPPLHPSPPPTITPPPLGLTLPELVTQPGLTESPTLATTSPFTASDSPPFTNFVSDSDRVPTPQQFAIFQPPAAEITANVQLGSNANQAEIIYPTRTKPAPKSSPAQANWVDVFVGSSPVQMKSEATATPASSQAVTFSPTESELPSALPMTPVAHSVPLPMISEDTFFSTATDSSPSFALPPVSVLPTYHPHRFLNELSQPGRFTNPALNKPESFSPRPEVFTGRFVTFTQMLTHFVREAVSHLSAGAQLTHGFTTVGNNDYRIDCTYDPSNGSLTVTATRVIDGRTKTRTFRLNYISPTYLRSADHFALSAGTHPRPTTLADIMAGQLHKEPVYVPH